ncbi:MAG: hypothetical protein CVU39_20010 [Chloroflexi bacterium HGW-Chloroflexi-10]|nr:MAG: hypothetical protein CVU39_20010 [Chloroflexi bacterium HGW-Chloroflexi-10]
MSVGEDCAIKVFAENFTGMSRMSSTAVVVDASGNKVSETGYAGLPFGKISYTEVRPHTDKTYTGQRSETGFYAGWQISASDVDQTELEIIMRQSLGLNAPDGPTTKGISSGATAEWYWLPKP